MKKNIVLCADDYGQAPAISKAIFTLVQQGRLSAVSCMVNTLYWQEHATWLLPFATQVDIGLHLNLTEGQALSQQYIDTYGPSFFSLPVLLRKALFRQLDIDVIEAECQAQIDHFVTATRFLPHFIDGHQHVHQFPIIRLALMRVYEQRLRQCNAYVRLVNEKIKLADFIHNFKKIIIYGTGTRALGKLLKKHKIRHNQSFAGIYAFDKTGRYAQLFPGFLKQMHHRGLIMCHPALASSEASDRIAAARFEEYQYLSSGQFISDCEGQNATLQRFY